jgi:hypothetical protein
LVERNQAEMARLERRAKFATDFMATASAVVAPAMREVATLIKDKGWSFCPNKQSRTCADYRYPHFSVVCDTLRKKVQFSTSTIGPGHGGSGLTVGDAELHELPSDLIQAKLIDYVKKLLNDAKPYSNR